MAVVTDVTGSEAKILKHPNLEVAHVTAANDGDHYFSEKFTKVTQAWIQINHTAANYSDEFYSVEVDATIPNKVIIQLAGSDTTAVPCTLVLAGEP